MGFDGFDGFALFFSSAQAMFANPGISRLNSLILQPPLPRSNCQLKGDMVT